jgi:oligopeptide/dipeptide ABC transporter ATP-binding protein
MSNILEVAHLKKYFKTPGGMLHAVDDVSFTIEKGKTLGVVGESGCGKSTLGRAVLGLHEATDGSVSFEGKDITHVSNRARKALWADMQMIFQDPFSSLNPRMCVFDLIADPLRVYKICKSKSEVQDKVFELMDTVGLARRLAFSYPHELDGGRRQRIGIARALSVQPKFIVCDEPVSALDVSIQAQVLNLLQDLQEEKELTYIFITHDLSVVKHISNDILVMYLGTVVEKCDSEELFEHPYHPYTKGLLSAIPVPDLENRPERIILQGELTSPVEPKNCCRFATRCPYATEQCRSEQPVLREISENHFISCFKAEEINGISE